MKLSLKPFCCGLPGAMYASRSACRTPRCRVAFEVPGWWDGPQPTPPLSITTAVARRRPFGPDLGVHARLAREGLRRSLGGGGGGGGPSRHSPNPPAEPGACPTARAPSRRGRPANRSSMSDPESLRRFVKLGSADPVVAPLVLLPPHEPLLAAADTRQAFASAERPLRIDGHAAHRFDSRGPPGFGPPDTREAAAGVTEWSERPADVRPAHGASRTLIRAWDAHGRLDGWIKRAI